MANLSAEPPSAFRPTRSVTYPCEQEGDPGEPILFQDGFPTQSGKGRFVPAAYTKAAELPDHDYPFVFLTGRQLEHWHTGSMTRRSVVLDAIEPRASIYINLDDLARSAARTVMY